MEENRKPLTFKQLKEHLNNMHPNWDNWIVLIENWDDPLHPSNDNEHATILSTDDIRMLDPFAYDNEDDEL